MEQLGVGVIGTGWAGTTYVDVFSGMPDVKVKVVCDLREDVARQLAERIGADWCTSYDAVMERSDVQAVGICTSDGEHTGPALSAARHGKHILLEKPIATSLADAEQIVATAHQAGVVLMIGHVLRFDPRWYGAKVAIANGDLGNVFSIYARRNATTVAQNRLKGRVTLPAFLGVHDYDAMRWLVGSDVVRVYAQSHYGFWTGRGLQIEDATFAVLNFANGAVGVSELNWAMPPGSVASDWRVDVTGDAGSVHINHNPTLVKVDTQRATALDSLFTPYVHGRMTGAFVSELRHFVECAAGGKPPAVTGEDGLAALRVVLAVEESARTGQPVELAAVRS